MAEVGVGLLGCGAVGSAVARRLADSRDVHVRSLAVRRPAMSRPCPVPPEVTSDPLHVVEDPSVDLVVEVMGPVAVAKAAIERSLELGKAVVTANKALIALHGPELRQAAAAAGVPLLFEAAVGGGVPVLRTIAALAAGDTITRIEGVLNGTVTYVLHRIEQGASLAEAVESAQSAGLAEADPIRDLDGRDVADKLAVVAQIAFGTPTRATDVDVLGIEWLAPEDVVSAARKGKRWRLVAVANRGRCCRVEPMLVDEADPFAALTGAENAIVITTERTGSVALRGIGAGGESTATAVLADVAEVVGRGWRR